MTDATMHSIADIDSLRPTWQRLMADVAAGRVPHALMLTGPDGTATLAMAVELAKALLCQTPHADGTPCHECLQCRMAARLEHPDLHFAFPIATGTGTRVSAPKDAISDAYIKEWRERLRQSPWLTPDEWAKAMCGGTRQAKYYVAESDNLQRKLVLKSSQGGRKVVVMWLPEKMGPDVANKLLKLLEEPPAGTHFVMASDEPDLLLSTIRSRVQTVMLPPLTRQERESTQPWRDESECMQLFVTLMRLAYQRDVRQMRAWAEQLAALGREQQRAFLSFCQGQVRDNFIYNFRQPALIDQTPEEEAFSRNFARFVNEWNVIGITDELAQAQRDLEQNTNARMVFFDLALKMTVLIITPATHNK